MFIDYNGRFGFKLSWGDELYLCIDGRLKLSFKSEIMKFILLFVLWPISSSKVGLQKVGFIDNSHSNKLIALKIVMRWNSNDDITVVGWNVDYFILLCVSWNKVEILNGSWDWGLESYYLGNESYSSIFYFNDQRKCYLLDFCIHSHWEVYWWPIKEKLDLQIDH